MASFAGFFGLDVQGLVWILHEYAGFGGFGRCSECLFSTSCWVRVVIFLFLGDGGVWEELNMVALIVRDGFWAGGAGWGQVVDLVGKIFWWGL